MSNIAHEKSVNSRRLGVVVCACSSIAYCLLVIWYVTTFPDIGLRCLLPSTADENDELHITQFVNSEESISGEQIGANDKLIEIARRPSGNFMLFIRNLARLRSAPIPPGGMLPPGSDPAEEPPEKVPELVEVLGSTEGDGNTRMVELLVRLPNSSFADRSQRIYVALQSQKPTDFVLTIVWFLCQLGILLVAMTAWWQRPDDRVVRIFCLMCCASMVAFVGGFHWWILVASPLLNLPFIFCACLLPPVTLHFFCSFPRQHYLLQRHEQLVRSLIYVPPIIAATVIAFVYWATFGLTSGEPGQFSVFHKLSAVVTGLLRDGQLSFDASVVVAQLLYVLRIICYAAIALSSAYFVLTVFVLASTLMRAQNAVERRQTSGILTASLAATIPIAYTLYLAFFQKESFALGKAQFPMFVASGLFMAAYAHGMLKHRLILADETLMRGRQYFLMSSLVSIVTAITLGAGAVATRIYALPNESSIPVHLASFLVLVIAIGFILWARDLVQAMVDQRFFSEKYQIDRTLKQLNKASGYLADPSALADITLVTCRDVMDASTASMYVRDPRETLRLIGTDDQADVPVTLPVAAISGSSDSEMVVRRIPGTSREQQTAVQRLLHELHAELICLLRGEAGADGIIVLGRRRNGSPYSAEDIAFLQAIGQMTVLALHSSRANQNLSRLNSELEMKVGRIAEQQRQLSILRAELTSLQQAAGPNDDHPVDNGFDRGEIRGSSRQIHAVLEMVRKAAASTSTVLVRGESGTGKELVARVVHRNSDRADKPLISLNCAALAPSLLESELFGHARGAFTGAHSDKEGRFKSADGGTLFLDEIGDISLEIQVKLLRVLQERCFEPVGSNKTVNIDVRLIAATNRNLEKMIETGEFREDLYYRLNVISVTLPPLRERREDLIELVFFFLNRGIRKTGKTIRQIEPEALAAIEQHDWPGNIRQLENVIERAIVLAEGHSITLKDLPLEISAAGVPVVAEDSRTWQDVKPNSAWIDTGDPETGIVTRGHSFGDVAEKDQLVTALRAAEGNKARAARSLKMPRSTFYSKLKKYGLGE